MEALAAESQALVHKAFAMVRANGVTRDTAISPRAPVDSGESVGQPGEGSTSNDVDNA